MNQRDFKLEKWDIKAQAQLKLRLISVDRKGATVQLGSGEPFHVSVGDKLDINCNINAGYNNDEI